MHACWEVREALTLKARSISISQNSCDILHFNKGSQFVRIREGPKTEHMHSAINTDNENAKVIENTLKLDL